MARPADPTGSTTDQKYCPPSTTASTSSSFTDKAVGKTPSSWPPELANGSGDRVFRVRSSEFGWCGCVFG